MAYFDKDFLAFFKELEANNHKDWFDDNRKRYEKIVKEPFKIFVDVMIERMRETDPNINITPKDAIFRINRDIRFSKDKTPYKTHYSAAISPGGRKDHTTPGLYIQMNHTDLRIYSGMYIMEKEQLHTVRSYISENLEEFDNALNDKNFKKIFGQVHGEKNKRLPKEFQEAGEQQPLLYNKGFYFYHIMDSTVILKDDLPTIIMDTYSAGKPVRDFLVEALGE